MQTPPQLIADTESAAALLARLRTATRIAFDTESASFHRYVDRVYLVQVSTDRETALIDPLGISDLGGIGSLLADPAIEVVFHDADYDLRILDRDFGFRASRLFDTRIAAQFAGEPSFGLAALLQKHFGITLDKKLQRADWSRRPLTDEMIAYAADDTRFLLQLRDLLAGQLDRLSRRRWAEEEFARLVAVRWTKAHSDRDLAFLTIRGASALPVRNRAVLQQLHDWRDRTARELDRAAFRIVGNAELVAIARAIPKNRRELDTVPGLPAATSARWGEGLLGAVAAGLATPTTTLPAIPRQQRPRLDPAYDSRLERLRTLRTERAAAIGLDQGLVCPNSTLQAIARALPRSPDDLAGVAELRVWQREVLGDPAILGAVRPI